MRKDHDGTNMRPALLPVCLYALAACTTTDSSSLGDSPVHDISCPIYMDWEMCASRGERICKGVGYQLISPSAEELEEDRVQGRTVPMDGDIRYRTITIMCNE